MRHGEVSMAMDLEKLRKLLSLDPDDPLSRFALGRKLAEIGEHAEAVEHLRFANVAAPAHLATYRVLSESLMALGHRDEAKKVLTVGIEKVRGVGEGMGRDLGPIMQEMLDRL
jgi:predicted Zn-dependent protease